MKANHKQEKQLDAIHGDTMSEENQLHSQMILSMLNDYIIANEIDITSLWLTRVTSCGYKLAVVCKVRSHREYLDLQERVKNRFK